MIPGEIAPAVAIGLPAATVAVMAVVLGVQRRNQPLGAPANVGWEGLALCAGIAATLLLLRDGSGFPPRDLNDWPLFLILPAALAAAFTTARFAIRAGLAALAIAIALPLILTILRRSWSGGEAVLWLGSLGALWLGLALAARATADRLPAAALPAWAGALGVAAYVLANSATSIAHGQLTAGVGIAAGVLGLLRLAWGDRIRPGSAVTAIALIAPIWPLLTLELSSNHLLPWPALGVLLLAPLAAWATWPLRQRPWLAGCAALVLGAAVAALSLLLLSPPPPPDPSGW